MATGIYKRVDQHGNVSYRAHVHRKGHKHLSKVFKYEKDAVRWKKEQDRSIDLTGLPQTIDELKKNTVGDIVRRYLVEITPTKGCAYSETTVLNKFLRRDICRKSLAYVSKKDAYEYIDFRLRKDTFRDKPISPSAVRRELNTVQHVFEIAKERWGYTNLTNPFRSIAIKGSKPRRKRKLEAGELERLEKACEDCLLLNRIYIPLAIHLAVDTGMRQQEIFNLTWQDIKLRERRIEIQKSKTDYLNEFAGRTIVLPFTALIWIMRLMILIHRLSKNGVDIHGAQLTDHPFASHIFPRTGKGKDPRNAFKQAWADVVKRANISDLHFHDLRHTAASRFHEAGLTAPEQDLMMGHTNKSINSLYIHPELKSIQDKLDRYVLNGETLEEKAARGEKATRHLSTDDCMEVVFTANLDKLRETPDLIDEAFNVIPFPVSRTTR
jgi:integrase